MKYLAPRANLIFKNVFDKRPGLMPGFPNTMLPLKDDGLVESIVELFLKKAVSSFKNDYFCSRKRKRGYLTHPLLFACIFLRT